MCNFYSYPAYRILTTRRSKTLMVGLSVYCLVLVGGAFRDGAVLSILVYEQAALLFLFTPILTSPPPFRTQHTLYLLLSTSSNPVYLSPSLSLSFHFPVSCLLFLGDTFYFVSHLSSACLSLCEVIMFPRILLLSIAILTLAVFSLIP